MRSLSSFSSDLRRKFKGHSLSFTRDDFIHLQSSKEKITIKNNDKLKRILEEFNSDPSKIRIVTDFDFTLTAKYNYKMSSTYKSSYCQLKNWYNMSQKFLNDSKMLYEKYAPLENKISTDNLKKRNEEIFTWFHQNMMLLAKEKIHKKDFKDMILMSQGSFYFRHGLDRTFSYMENYNIPMYIVSGGVQPVIEESLRLLVHDYEDLKKRGLLKIVANGLTFNRSTNLIEDYDRRITSTFNKADRLRESYLSDFDKEDNIILMGDHFGDSEIASKVPHKNVLKIAYYNDINLTPTNPTLYKKFQNDFDVLIEGDGSLAFINEILHKSLFSEDR